MAITTAICNSFKQQLFEGVHNFNVGTQEWKIALYDNGTATLGEATTAYTATGEIAGTGYTATGALLDSAAPTLSGSTMIQDFTTNPTWTTATFSADGSLIYYSGGSNQAIAVNNFGGTKTASGGDFQVNFPTPDAANGFLRLA